MGKGDLFLFLPPAFGLQFESRSQRLDQEEEQEAPLLPPILSETIFRKPVLQEALQKSVECKAFGLGGFFQSDGLIRTLFPKDS